MTARPFPNPRSLGRIRQPWLRERVSAFLGGLAVQGFKTCTLRGYAQQLIGFASFAERQGVLEPAQLAGWVEPFARPLVHPKRRKQRAAFLTRFVAFVAPQCVERPAVVADPRAQTVEEYAAFLREHRGLRPKTIRFVRHTCAALLTFLGGEGVSELGSLRAEHVHRFVTAQGEHYSRVSMRSLCGALRGFLAHLYRRGVLAIDLSLAVVSPRVYRHEQCPRFLTRTEVDAMLAAVDRSTPSGKRTYAMFLLLATYGLRGIEVRSLRLDDIDWRNDRIRIANRKAGNSTDYPLAASVGEAILDYLRNGRPASAHREVFLTAIGPTKPLTRPEPIAYQVRKHLARAGVTAQRPGTHSFRYSCAQRLLESGTPLKAIGDYLGHSHPDSTQRYVKIAIDQLREVASGDVEDVL